MPEREAVVAALRAALAGAAPGSRVLRRGSVRDELSDIDLAWIVPDAGFASALAAARQAFAAVGPVALLRADVELQRSDRRRLLFVTYEHLPLCWRVDVDVRAESVAPGRSRDSRRSPPAYVITYKRNGGCR